MKHYVSRKSLRKRVVDDVRSLESQYTPLIELPVQVLLEGESDLWVTIYKKVVGRREVLRYVKPYIFFRQEESPHSWWYYGLAFDKAKEQHGGKGFELLIEHKFRHPILEEIFQHEDIFWGEDQVRELIRKYSDDFYNGTRIFDDE